MIELRHNDLVGIGAVIEKDDLDINSKMVFKLFEMPMKTDFPKELSPTIDATQIFEPKSADIFKNDIQCKEEKQLNDMVEDDKANEEITKEHIVKSNRSGSPEYCHIQGMENKTDIEKQCMRATTTTNQSLHPLINQKKETESGLYEDEIVISDDEEFLFSQSIMNKVKEDLEELDNDVICVSDDLKLSDELICLESKDVFDSWHQNNIKSSIKLKDENASHFQPSTLNWMYSQSDVLLCRVKTGVDTITETKQEDNSKLKVLESEEEYKIKDSDKQSSEISKAVKTRSSAKKKKNNKVQEAELVLEKNANETDKRETKLRDSRQPSASKYQESQTKIDNKKTSSKTQSPSKKKKGSQKKESSSKTGTSIEEKKQNKQGYSGASSKESCVVKTHFSSSRARSSRNEAKDKSKKIKSGDKVSEKQASLLEEKNYKISERNANNSSNIEKSVHKKKTNKERPPELCKNSSLRRRSKSLAANRLEIRIGKLYFTNFFINRAAQ